MLPRHRTLTGFAAAILLVIAIALLLGRGFNQARPEDDPLEALKAEIRREGQPGHPLEALDMGWLLGVLGGLLLVLLLARGR